MLKVINLFGGPGSGKSTTAAGLFWEMKNARLNVELVSEFAKGMAWAERVKELTDQPYILGQQYHRLHVLKDKVEWAITDSPLPLVLLYGHEPTALFKGVTMELFNEFENYNFFVERVKPYVSIGRFQGQSEAEIIDWRTRALLQMYALPHHFVDGDNTSCTQILNLLEALCPTFGKTQATPPPMASSPKDAPGVSSPGSN